MTLAEPLDLDALRIRHEFLSVPDLKLSPDQVVSLLNVSRHHALALLETLVVEQFLTRQPDGGYSRSPSPTRV